MPEDKQEGADEAQQAEQPPGPPEESEEAEEAGEAPASRRRIRPPALFLGLCVAFGVISYFAYPKPADEPVPGYSTIDVVSTFPVGIIDFSARPMSGDTVEVKVALAQSELLKAPTSTTSATVYFAPSNGIPFTQCPHLTPCAQEVRQEPGAQARQVTFAPGPGATATATFLTKASGVLPAANGLTASAALPQAFYNCPETDPQCPAPTLETHYDVPSAASYDWSSVPYQHVTATSITWAEQLAGGSASGRVAVGINAGNQSWNDTRTFLAGALIGLAGGALIAAVQERLHPDK